MSANLCERVAGVALLSAALLVVPAAGAAQGPPGGGGDKVKVTLNQNVVTFPMPGVTEFDAGWVDATGIVVSVQPRKNQTGPWELRIRTDDLDMGGYG
ncbi:MAG: hypothetical protein GWN71_12935, partial [Gammaproteobacteria bacterium]|nr:hypothetical protein [Gemmatimonadota bacterium]NIU74451.1 hypothetical protein [Gammaproteobacteria bacterium]